jgi:hypothetical protein
MLEYLSRLETYLDSFNEKLHESVLSIEKSLHSVLNYLENHRGRYD